MYKIHFKHPTLSVEFKKVPPYTTFHLEWTFHVPLATPCETQLYPMAEDTGAVKAALQSSTLTLPHFNAKPVPHAPLAKPKLLPAPLAAIGYVEIAQQAPMA